MDLQVVCAWWNLNLRQNLNRSGGQLDRARSDAQRTAYRGIARSSSARREEQWQTCRDKQGRYSCGQAQLRHLNRDRRHAPRSRAYLDLMDSRRKTGG